jgi:hypothetical protein
MTSSSSAVVKAGCRSSFKYPLPLSLTTGMQINIQKSTLSFSEMEREEEEIYTKALSFYFSRLLRRPKISWFSPKTK